MKTIALRVLSASISLIGCGGQVDDAPEPRTIQQAVCSNPLPPPLADISRGWPTGIVSYKFQGVATDTHKNNLRAFFTEWQAQSQIITFNEAPNDPRAAIIVVEDTVPPHRGCEQSFLPPRCLPVPASHEVGHLIGLAHEQQRMDSSRFIVLNQSDDICDDRSEGTKYRDTIWSGTNYGPYNEDSVMHYTPVLGLDSTYDFTDHAGGVSSFQGITTIRPSDSSSVKEHVARHFGWDRYRNRGTNVGPGPLMPQVASGVSIQPGSPIAAARMLTVDVTLVMGTDGQVYARSFGTGSSTWRVLLPQASALAATTMSNQLVVAHVAASAVFVQRSTNAFTLARAQPTGSSAFMDALTWAANVNFGLPSGVTAVTGLATASLHTTHLAVLVRGTNGSLWLRNTTAFPSVNGTWIQVASTSSGARPALAAHAGQLRVYFSVSSAGTQLQEALCSTTSCQPAIGVASVQTGTTAAVAASETELHLVLKNPAGQVV